MRMHIKELADAAGVSVRTLHYYDEIGLLKPAHVDPATGYRFYDEHSFLRLQEILFCRELDFPLKSIGEFLSSPHYDRSKALQEQKHLLTLKKQRLEGLIAALDGAMKGENIMKAFDHTAFDQYKQEARERWGQTPAYQEHTEKTKHYTNEKWSALTGDMDQIMAAFAACLQAGHSPASAPAQELVKALQNHITKNYYHCTNPILLGLSQMYVSDDRFRQNIDRHGKGTAAFICEAVGVYATHK